MVGENGKSTKIVLVTQDLSQIASFERVLVEYTYRSTKLNVVGRDDNFRVDVYTGPVTGASPPKSKRLRDILGTYKPEIYKLYSSHTLSETGKAGDEKTIDNRFNILKGSKLKWYAITIAVLIWFVIWAFTKVTGHYGNDETNSLPENLPPPELFGLKQVDQTPTITKHARYDVFRGKRPYISFNNGVFPDIKYSIAVNENGEYFEIDAEDLAELGYDIQPVSSCLILIKTGPETYPVACRIEKQKEEQDNPLSNLF